MEPKFQLSGIRSDVLINDIFYVPPSRDLALVGWRSKVTNTAVTLARCTHILVPPTVMEPIRRRTRGPQPPIVPDGYLIHARCWSLLEHIVGPVDDEKLPFLFSALKRRYSEGPMVVDRLSHFLTNSEYPFLRVPTFYDSDPWKISAVRDLFIKSREGIVNGPLASTSLAQDNDDTILQHPLALLPVEIKLLILDQLGPDDASSMVRAWNWVTPDSYWKLRFPSDILFEIKNEDMNYPVDWMSLCFAAEKMIDVSYGVRNRRRIFKILERTKMYYLDSLNGRVDVHH